MNAKKEQIRLLKSVCDSYGITTSELSKKSGFSVDALRTGFHRYSMSNERIHAIQEAMLFLIKEKKAQLLKAEKAVNQI